jgi:hypothetical protein
MHPVSVWRDTKDRGCLRCILKIDLRRGVGEGIVVNILCPLVCCNNVFNVVFAGTISFYAARPEICGG